MWGAGDHLPPTCRGQHGPASSLPSTCSPSIFRSCAPQSLPGGQSLPPVLGWGHGCSHGQGHGCGHGQGHGWGHGQGHGWGHGQGAAVAESQAPTQPRVPQSTSRPSPEEGPAGRWLPCLQAQHGPSELGVDGLPGGGSPQGLQDPPVKPACEAVGGRDHESSGGQGPSQPCLPAPPSHVPPHAPLPAPSAPPAPSPCPACAPLLPSCPEPSPADHLCQPAVSCVPDSARSPQPCPPATLPSA